MGFLTGKSKQKSSSSSENKAFDYIKNAYSGAVGTGTGATSQIGALLGLGGDTGAANKAFKDYQDSTGYQEQVNAGTDAIVGNGAARGLLRSGSSGKAITQFAQDTAKNSFQSYLSNLLGLGNQGLQAGGLIAGAGQTSQATQSSKSKPGLDGAIGAGISMIPSDRRLKKDILKIGEKDGLGVYEYRYKWESSDKPVRRGYIAQEVAKIAPDALGTKIGRFMTVDYSKLPAIEEE